MDRSSPVRAPLKDRNLYWVNLEVHKESGKFSSCTEPLEAWSYAGLKWFAFASMRYSSLLSFRSDEADSILLLASLFYETIASSFIAPYDPCHFLGNASLLSSL